MELKMGIINFTITVQHIINNLPPDLIVGLYKMVENYQKEQNDSNYVAEHGQLYV